MKSTKFGSFFILILLSAPAFADPTLTAVPLGLQAGNWVWRIDITPDLSLPPNGRTPVAVELGFRLTGAPLLGVLNINPLEFPMTNPGLEIFGWENSCGPAYNNHPCGLQFDTNEDEIFAAFGSVIFDTPGPKPLLEIVTEGPATSGIDYSTIEWVGAYNGNGLIAQIIGQNPNGQFIADAFEVHGSATQMVPEPAGGLLLLIGSLLLMSRTTACRRSR